MWLIYEHYGEGWGRNAGEIGKGGERWEKAGRGGGGGAVILCAWAACYNCCLLFLYYFL